MQIFKIVDSLFRIAQLGLRPLEQTAERQDSSEYFGEREMKFQEMEHRMGTSPDSSCSKKPRPDRRKVELMAEARATSAPRHSIYCTY